MGVEKRQVKVAKFRILKPCNMEWDEFGTMLRNVRYRVFRLANLAVSEAYLNYHLFKNKEKGQYTPVSMGALNKQLREILIKEGTPEEDLNRFSRNGVLPSYVTDALSKYKIHAITNLKKWKDVINGRVSLPTFRNDMAIPVRCDKPGASRLEKTESGEVEVNLMICMSPYPRVLLGTKNIGDGQEAILQRLLANKEQSDDGYRQRCFEIKQDRLDRKWWLFVTYDFPVCRQTEKNPDTIVGVDLGVSVPLYVAINNGKVRLGRKHFSSLGHRIRSLQNQVEARRRSIQRGGRLNLSVETSRSGHGRKRKMLPTEKLMGRIDRAYTTLNHQLSSAVIDFALAHGAGTIQVEDLTGLQEQLKGTFIGRRWRYHQLQQFLEYKAAENGIVFRKINPKYTSRRCSECGWIHVEFDRTYRDKEKTKAKVAEFICPECGYKEDPDYNAARNIATLDIENKIKVQCQKQKIE